MLKTKVCIKCKIEKSLNEYNFHDKRKGTLRNVCKKCFGKQKRNHFLKNKDKYKKLNTLWREKNKDKIKEYCKQNHKKYYQKNKKKIDNKNKKYYLANKAKLRLLSKIWYKNNSDKIRVYKQRKKIKQKNYNIKGDFTEKQWGNLKKQYNYICILCNQKEPFLDNKVTVELTVDHIIPISKWNIWIKDHPEITYECNQIENIQPLCHSCNSSKNNRL